MAEYTNVQKFLAALIAPFQDVEEMWHQFRTARNVDTAQGVWLTLLGKLVGCRVARDPDDEIYRRYVRAWVAANKSDGRIDDLIRIAELVVFDDNAEYVVDNTGIASLYLRVEGVELSPAIVQVLITMLRKAVKGGVRIVLRYWPTTEARFRCAPFTGSPTAGTGCGSFADPSAGGHLAGARE